MTKPSDEAVRVWQDAQASFNRSRNPHNYSNAGTDAERCCDADDAAAAIIQAALDAQAEAIAVWLEKGQGLANTANIVRSGE